MTVFAGTLRWAERLHLSEQQIDGVRVVFAHRDDYHYERWHKLWHPGVSAAFTDLVRQLAPDVVHVHHRLRLSADLVACGRRAGVPAVVTLHDFSATCPTIDRILPDGSVCHVATAPEPCLRCVGVDRLLGEPRTAAAVTVRARVLARELDLAARVLVLSRAQGDLLARVHPGVAFTPHPFAAGRTLRRSPVPASDRPLRVATLGRINPGKGQHLLLEAVRGLSDPTAVELHLFGEIDGDDHRERLRELARRLRVHWHGAYQPADLEQTPLHLVALTSTRHETYGFVLDEAHMLGVPVLASDTGAYPERVGAGGVTFRGGDATALRTELQHLVDHPERLAGLRAAVPAVATFDQHLAFLESLYAEVSRHRPPPVDSDDTELVADLFARADRLERLAD